MAPFGIFLAEKVIVSFSDTQVSSWWRPNNSRLVNIQVYVLEKDKHYQ